MTTRQAVGILQDGVNQHGTDSLSALVDATGIPGFWDCIGAPWHIGHVGVEVDGAIGRTALFAGSIDPVAVVDDAGRVTDHFHYEVAK